MKPKLVQITWLDSKQSDGTWRWLDEMGKQKPSKIRTMGWLIQDDKECKVIAQSLSVKSSGDRQVAGCKIIPTCCVLEVRKF